MKDPCGSHARPDPIDPTLIASAERTAHRAPASALKAAREAARANGSLA